MPCRAGLVAAAAAAAAAARPGPHHRVMESNGTAGARKAGFRMRLSCSTNNARRRRADRDDAAVAGYVIDAPCIYVASVAVAESERPTQRATTVCSAQGCTQAR